MSLKYLEVNITSDDIIHGSACSNLECAVARAVNRAAGGLTRERHGAWVGADFVMCIPHYSTTAAVLLPPRVKKFIADFDQGKKVTPLKFELPLK